MRQNNTPLSRFWLGMGILYGATLVFIGWSAYTDRLPDYLGLIPHYDVIGHFFLYGMATFLGQVICQQWRLPLAGLKLPIFPFIFTLITLIDEGLQHLSPVRTFSLLDLTMSLLGIIVGYGLAQRLRGRLGVATRSTVAKDEQGE
ncbi:MAG: hypothetical protein AAGG51_19025 [Cyanobacteria bacterium P01_G01_bin.54]